MQQVSEQIRERTAAPQEGAREKTCWQCGHTLITSDLFCPHDGARLIDITLSDDHDPLIGQLIDGRYLVHGRVGEGGMGMVYRAAPRDGTPDVAIKVLKADYLRDEQIRRRFMHEARIIANLEHPHAVRLHDFGQMPDGNFFMVMELLQGESLAERLTYKFLTWREIFDILSPICVVLAEAHKKGVVHRDLKPENIFICKGADGVELPKLIDFGVARQLDQATITHTGAMWGTPAYMSPEQARGERVEAAADNYAIGIILYELICGTLPFNATSQMGYAVKHMHEQPRSLTTLPGLESPPAAIDALILALLDKNPAQRPGPADQIAVELDAIRARYFDDELLDLTPAMEIDPIALQHWLKESELRSTPDRPLYAANPMTPPYGAQGLEVSRTYEDLVIPQPDPYVARLTHQTLENPPQPIVKPRLSLAAVISAVALLTGGVAIALILTAGPDPDAEPLPEPVVELAPASASPIAAAATTTAAAPQRPHPALGEAVQDAIARAGALAGQTAMRAQLLGEPEEAAPDRASTRAVRTSKRPTQLPDKKTGPSLRDAIKKTF